jgi:hypothetical protein
LPSVPSSWSAVELRSPSVNVEWAAVVRSACSSSGGRSVTVSPTPPQLTTMRSWPSLNSNARVEAQPPLSVRLHGGGAASNTSALPRAASRW